MVRTEGAEVPVLVSKRSDGFYIILIHKVMWLSGPDE